ncbi:hypothetical protein N566_04275 [Streptomycetaceae bacterium MP113-05]|nr:hypothetical protein N566_04275 [Streptomycetaceae bacterium MP113-05]
MRVRTSLAAAALATVGVLGAAGTASADGIARGTAVNSPGVLSGNVFQVPVHAPVNVCGNSLNVIGALNPTLGNVCING